MAAAATAKPLVQLALAALLHHQLATGASASPTKPGQGRARAGGRIQWAGRTFPNPAALVAFINAQGGHTSVDQFLGNHPGVAAQYGQRQVGAGGGFPQPQPGAMPAAPPSLIGPPAPAHQPPALIGPPVPAHQPPALIGPPVPAGHPPPDLIGPPVPAAVGGGDLLARLRALLALRAA